MGGQVQGGGEVVSASYFLALGLDEYGHHTEAENVRNGVDLESYRHDLFAIEAALASRAAPPSAPVGVEGLVKAMRTLAGVGIPVKPECVGRWADQLEALAQQPAAAPLEMRICELRHVILHPGQPYVFTVDPNCEACRSVAGSGDYSSPAQQPAAVDGAVRQAAQEMVAAIRAVPEAKLLALDADPHPPSALSVLADDLAAALATKLGEE